MELVFTARKIVLYMKMVFAKPVHLNTFLMIKMYALNRQIKWPNIIVKNKIQMEIVFLVLIIK
jgi:hypothetical protein